MHFIYDSAPLSSAAVESLGALEEVLRGSAAAATAAGARFVVAFAPDKFRACRRELAIDADSDLAGWVVSDLPARLAAITSHLPGQSAFIDLTPGLAAQSAAGELPYFREDSHWNSLGNRFVGEALAALIEPLLRGRGGDAPSAILQRAIREASSAGGN